jgi:hypothetical protein
LVVLITDACGGGLREAPLSEEDGPDRSTGGITVGWCSSWIAWSKAGFEQFDAVRPDRVPTGFLKTVELRQTEVVSSGRRDPGGPVLR